MHATWPSGSDLQPAEAAMIAAQQQKRYTDSNPEAYTSFPHSDPGESQGLQDPQQTELLHAMQNVTGRFIRSAVTQLRKRAAALCIEELKEYKRSKILNILEAPRQTQASHSRPSSASYLVPTAPSSYNTADAAQRSLPDTLCTPSDSSLQKSAPGQPGVPRNELSRENITQQGIHGSSVHATQGMPASMPGQAPTLLGRHMQDHNCSLQPTQDIVACLPNKAQQSRGNNDRQLFDAATAAPPGAVDLQCSSASVSLDGSASDSQPSVGKHEVQLPSKQTAYTTSWRQGVSQPLASGNGWLHVPSQPVRQFSPAKLACMPSFSFGKQPCPVMW